MMVMMCLWLLLCSLRVWRHGGGGWRWVQHGLNEPDPQHTQSFEMHSSAGQLPVCQAVCSDGLGTLFEDARLSCSTGACVW
jgi:hypothetical protein